MLIDYEYKNKKLLVSYIDNTGNIKLKYYPWENPKKWLVCDEYDSDKSSKYKFWDGRPVKEIFTSRPSRSSIIDFIDALPQNEQNDIFEYNPANIFFMDIENEIVGEKVAPELAQGEIQTISIVNKDKVLVLGTKDFPQKDSDAIANEINAYFSKFKTNYTFMYKKYDSEYDMLLNLFKVMIPRMAVITGWNYTNYDFVYLVNRARKIGVDPTTASFTGLLREPYQDDTKVELPAHRLVIDYMDLYAKYDQSVKVKESNSLNFVSEHLLGLKKVNYEGNLTHLHQNDYHKFVLYNAIDSVLVQQIHLKMKYIDIMYGIATLSRIRVADAISTIPVTEGILRKPFKDKKNVVFAVDPTKNTEGNGGISVVGGWVKDPVIGMSRWCICTDFSSLYPSTIREFNISADSYKGLLISDKGKTVEDMILKLRSGEDVYCSYRNEKKKLEIDDIICLNGAVFKNETGIVKQVIEDIFFERKRYKKKMMVVNLEINDLEKELEKLKNELG